MLLRLKHASMVLIGRRPAEVRFDESDQHLARELSREWSQTYCGFHPQPGRDDSGAEFEEFIFNAICEYASRESVARDMARARKRWEKLDRQMKIPF